MIRLLSAAINYVFASALLARMLLRGMGGARRAAGSGGERGHATRPPPSPSPCRRVLQQGYLSTTHIARYLSIDYDIFHHVRSTGTFFLKVFFWVGYLAPLKWVTLQNRGSPLPQRTFVGLRACPCLNQMTLGYIHHVQRCCPFSTLLSCPGLRRCGGPEI